jgi:hypothetical protein
MPCIYCKQERPAKGVEHVWSEALGKHDFVVPKGAACDICNGGVLRRLDDAIIASPRVWPHVFNLRKLNKKGRTSREVGFFERSKDDSMTTIKVPRNRIVSTQVHEAGIHVQADHPSNYKQELFIRGLYKIALNFVAHTDGVERALHSDYDAVRTYVANPGNLRKQLPHVRKRIQLQRRVSVRAFDGDNFELMEITLFGDRYFVDLVKPDQVHDVVRDIVVVGNELSYFFCYSDGRVTDWHGTQLTYTQAPLK